MEFLALLLDQYVGGVTLDIILTRPHRVHVQPALMLIIATLPLLISVILAYKVLLCVPFAIQGITLQQVFAWLAQR